MNDSTKRQKMNIIRQFRQFYNRVSFRRRWNTFFSGLITVCLMWLLIKLSGAIQGHPVNHFVSFSILLAGTVVCFVLAYRRSPKRSEAIYVFDRTNRCSSLFITLMSTQQSGANRTVNQGSIEEAALVNRLSEQLSDPIPEPDLLFPAGKASACACLLVMGFWMPDFSSVLIFSTGSSHATNRPVESDQRDVSENDIENEREKQTVSDERDNTLTELENRYRELKQRRESSDSTETLSDRRENLKEDLQSFLDRQTNSSNETSNSPNPGQETNSSDRPEEANQPASSPENSSGENESSDTAGTGAGAGKSDSSKSSRNQVPAVGESSPEDQVKLAQEMLDQLDTEWTLSGENEKRTRNQAGKRRTSRATNEIMTSLPEPDPDTGQYQIDLSELQTAFNRHPQVRTWPPKYDHSIEAYRSFFTSSPYSGESENEENN